MIFSTILFLFRFLPITLALYYLAPAKLKNLALFLCSLVFYSWGEVKFFPVMVVLILINYTCGLLMEKFDSSVKARRVLLAHHAAAAGVLLLTVADPVVLGLAIWTAAAVVAAVKKGGAR